MKKLNLQDQREEGISSSDESGIDIQFVWFKGVESKVIPFGDRKVKTFQEEVNMDR